MSIHHLWRQSDLNSPSDWLGSQRRHGRLRGDKEHVVGARRESAPTASRAPVVPTLQPDPGERGRRSSTAATLERLAGRFGAEFLPKGTLRAIVEKAATAGDDEARALLDRGALSDYHIER